MVDWRCRESEGKAKIKGYMSLSDEEAHHHEAFVAWYVSGERRSFGSGARSLRQAVQEVGKMRNEVYSTKITNQRGNW